MMKRQKTQDQKNLVAQKIHVSNFVDMLEINMRDYHYRNIKAGAKMGQVQYQLKI